MLIAVCAKKDWPVQLFVVGHGPYSEAREILPAAFFTVISAARIMATAYASADIFVFPSHNRLISADVTP